MDEKLEKYRSKVRRKEFFSKIKQRLISMVTFLPETKHKKDETIEIPDVSSIIQWDYSSLSEKDYFFCDKKDKLEEVESEGSENEEAYSNVSSEEEEESEHENEDKPPGEKKFKYIMFAIWLLFWATCWMIAIELQFGIVFLILSALFGIYFNTRTGPRRRGEVSAYSVFNKDCESIDGTLDAEQLQSEMLYGPFRSVR